MDEEVKIEGDLDIQKALKEFEAKSSVEEAQNAPEIAKTAELPKMVQLIMKWSGGAIKDQKTAEYILLGFALLVFAFSLFLFFGGKGGSVAVDSPGLETFKNAPSPITP